MCRGREGGRGRERQSWRKRNRGREVEKNNKEEEPRRDKETKTDHTLSERVFVFVDGLVPWNILPEAIASWLRTFLHSSVS